MEAPQDLIGRMTSMDTSHHDRRFDPICGMRLAPHEIATTVTYIGRTYTVCCEECR